MIDAQHRFCFVASAVQVNKHFMCANSPSKVQFLYS